MSLLFPSSRGSITCPWYTVGGKMSDKNLEQQINIKVCVKVGKIVSETLTVLTVAFLNGTGSSRKGEKMCKTIQEVGSKKHKGRSMNLGALRLKIRCDSNRRRIEYE
jgi:hypothetical protein